MNVHYLTDLEWHDLPLEKIQLEPRRLELWLTPFSEDAQDYRLLVFKVWDWGSMELEMGGSQREQQR